MTSKRIVDGYVFNYKDDDDSLGFYECRGRVEYDDNHDEIPEEKLWVAAGKLVDQLAKEGFRAEREHSEKGWVEVLIFEP